ncbi:UNVERIFIED_ORG: hypothetical protein HNP28_003309 [Comamonas terrigena]
MKRRAATSLRRRISWFCIPCIARKPSVFACVSNFFELLTHKPSGTSDVETSESLRRLGRFLQKPPCRPCPSRRAFSSATAPSYGGLWALQRPTARPSGATSRAGRRLPHVTQQMLADTTNHSPIDWQASRRGPLGVVGFRKPPASSLRVLERGLCPQKAFWQHSAKASASLPKTFRLPHQRPAGLGLAPPISRLRSDHFAAATGSSARPENRLPRA